MSTVAAQTKEDFFEDIANRIDIDDFTSSSILEFLNKERQCTFGTDDCATDIDVESIFEEINRLSDNSDQRSVEEILREAELLISKQPLIGCNGNGNGSNGVLAVGKYLGVTSMVSNNYKSQSLLPNSNFSHDNKLINNTFDQIVDDVAPDSIISEESTPKYMKQFSKSNSADYEDDDDDDDDATTIEEIAEGIETIQITLKENPTVDVTSSASKNINNDNIIKSSDDEICAVSSKELMMKKLDQNTKLPQSNDEFHKKIDNNATDNIKFKAEKMSDHKTNRKIKDNPALPLQSPTKLSRPVNFTKSLTRPHSTQSSYSEKNFCNKSTNPSPSTSMVSVKTSPIEGISISREHALKFEIDQIQEKLKDTEERLKSLRIQHDSLSQVHRDLRDDHNSLQEGSELLKLDVQHLTDCANILRSELKSARKDRDEAREVQKQLQIEVDESKTDKKQLLDQSAKDSKVIQDLQRQCKEMERILMRKHPDSVSALIVASKNQGGRFEDNSSSRRLLEQRIAQLESDAKEQDVKAQKILANVQARFNSVQSKYETHIADLETQVLSLQDINVKLNEKIEFQIVSLNNFTKSNNNFTSSGTQTQDIPERELKTNAISTQTDSRPNSALKQAPTSTGAASKKSKIPSAQTESTATTAYHAAAKEDAHLLATIRGMRVDLAIKDKAMQRLTRELDECKKTIKKLQKEKDLMRSDKASTSSSSASSSRKIYDPAQYSDGQCLSDTQALKEALNKIKLLEFDYKALHDKRLQDLKTLQAAHERELSSCHETVQILQQRLIERDEAFANQKRRKVPIDYYALKAKVTSLERRHSDREQRLHMLVEALSKGRLNGALEEILHENN